MAGKSFSLIATVFGAVIGYAAVDYFFSSGGSQRNLTVAQIEEEIFRTEGSDIYRLIREEFPDAYDAHIQEIQGVVNDGGLSMREIEARTFNMSRAFTADLRQRHAHHLSKAPVSDLLRIHTIQLDILKSIADDFELCTTVSVYGLAALNPEQAAQVDQSLVGASAVAVFEAIAAGRDTPQEHAPATEDDWTIFVEDLMQSDLAPPEALDAVFTNDTADAAAYCAGTIAIQSLLVENTRPEVTRIMAEITQEMARS